VVEKTVEEKDADPRLARKIEPPKFVERRLVDRKALVDRKHA